MHALLRRVHKAIFRSDGLHQLLAAGAFCGMIGAAEAADYKGPGLTADVYMGFQGSSQPVMRMYLGTSGARLEPFSRADDEPDFLIARLSEEAQYEVYLDRRRAYRTRMEADELASARGEFCADFASRTKTGSETVSGRRTEVWQCSGATDGPDQVVWWDPVLLAEIRKDRAGLVIELRNIEVGQPDPRLFNVPAGVRVIR
ncbi:MAG: hypothetical protein JSU82_13440 [Rhodospirillales bacterium]|nr:MAG: hypothetical protein JSU82_13440 [Rhodospirillales bacterium]